MSTIAIVGAGYVGVPLARVFADAGETVVLVDVQADRVAQLNRGESYIEDVPSEVLKAHVDAGLVTATTDYDELEGADAILVALPTPLSAQREPDLTILLDASREIATRLQAGPAGRARVDHVPRHDAGAGRAAARGERAQGRARTSTSPSRRSASIPAARTGRPRPPRRSSAA